MKHRYIEERGRPGRLGRIVRHDPRSVMFPAAAAERIVTARHSRRCPPFDQGDLGSCTGNAMAGLLMTRPVYVAGRALAERDAVRLYSRATELDGFTGTYPPDDTGSSGLAVAKAAQEAGYISSYQHAFGLDHVLGALVLRPVIVGVNWYSHMDALDGNHFAHVGGVVRGGHEFELVALDRRAKWVEAVNSWGLDWGWRGRFRLSWDDLGRLLDEDGDCTTVSV